ncbi:MAG: di-heme oxidoredictase family protein [Verrucomicrobiota bacterium JB023]|nr:di-heme oxidoredictase family protein [Verrucomicrobiota bacterium JB023]
MNQQIHRPPKSGIRGPSYPRWAFSPLSLLALAATSQAEVDLDLIESLHSSSIERISQAELNDRNQQDPLAAFLHAFELGDEMFEADFSIIDGGGSKVGNGERTTRVPRADLTGPGEWANHFPARSTGPNGTSCASCHFLPVADGAGGTSSDVHRDPFHTGDISQMIHRNTPHLHGMGAVQRLAEEMTVELQEQLATAIVDFSSQRGSTPITVSLEAKGVSFGKVIIKSASTSTSRRSGKSRRSNRTESTNERNHQGRMARPRRHENSSKAAPSGIEVDYSLLEGIDEDLVVKPIQWKGTFPSVRSFNLDAMHNELGIQPREILPDGMDGDGDGYIDEASIGDMTAMTLYMAAQPRPTTRVELGQYGLGPVVPAAEVALIDHGESVFNAIGCADCHIPSFTINEPIFSEPSTLSDYRDDVLPGGQDPIALGLDPSRPLTFDLTRDIPDNKVYDSSGNLVRHLGALESNGEGGAIIRPYGDLKRHDMGPEMAEAVDEAGTGASVFLTENLWGVGVTPPYLHDGRASTLTEAILWHGGDAAASREGFKNASPQDQEALLAFLENLVIFLPDED